LIHRIGGSQMSNILVTFEYNANTWSFADAEEHATLVARDLGGEIDETISDDDEVHQIIVLVEDSTVIDVREGLYELSAAQDDVTYKVEAED
jgi:hypothetical protein